MSAAEFLAHVLPPQGSIDLPYQPEQRWTVRQHILDLIEVLIKLLQHPLLAVTPPPPPASAASCPRAPVCLCAVESSSSKLSVRPGVPDAGAQKAAVHPS